jgi:hypothetical protein
MVGELMLVVLYRAVDQKFLSFHLFHRCLCAQIQVYQETTSEIVISWCTIIFQVDVERAWAAEIGC